MKDKKILHIISYDKFTENVIRKSVKCFDKCTHSFWINNYDRTKLGAFEVNLDIEGADVIIGRYDINSLSRLIQSGLKSDRIIIHGLFCNERMLEVLSLFTVICKKKCVWVMWGGDILPSNDTVCEKYRRFIISNIKRVGYASRDDVIKLKKNYRSFKGRAVKFFYPYNLYKGKTDERATGKEDVNIVILNSATASCRHEEAMNKIKTYDNGKINVYCILAYPQNGAYIQQVNSLGERLFGNRYHSVTKMMEYEEYQELLAGMDIAVLNNNRQQGGGNLNNIMYMGIKLLMSPENGLYNEYVKNGFKIYDINDLGKKVSLTCLSKEEACRNKRCIENFLSDEHYRKVWRKVMDI